MRILILRPEPEAGRMAKELRRRGHDAIAAPMLVRESLGSSSDDLAGRRWQGVLVTSPKALGDFPVPERLLDLPVFAVGAASAAAARAAGFRDVRTGPGTAEGLAADLRGRLDPAAGPLLWLAATDRSVDLAALLAGDGLAVDLVETYRMVPRGELTDAERAALAAGAIVVTASARTSAALADLLGRAGEGGARGQVVAAISQKAAAPLAAAGAGEVAVAGEPTAASLFALVEALSSRRGLTAPPAGDEIEQE